MMAAYGVFVPGIDLGDARPAFRAFALACIVPLLAVLGWDLLGDTGTHADLAAWWIGAVTAGATSRCLSGGWRRG
jgi:hypothetical protein